MGFLDGIYSYLAQNHTSFYGTRNMHLVELLDDSLGDSFLIRLPYARAVQWRKRTRYTSLHGHSSVLHVARVTS